MSASTKLSTSVKALCYLAQAYPEAKSSAEIALHINVNASKLRKLLSMLVKNDLVESAKGTAGGFLLKRQPSSIHLQEIYCSIEDRKAFHLDVNRKNIHRDNVAVKFNDFFLDLFADIQIDIEDKMRHITLNTIMKRTGIKYSYKEK